MKKITCLNLSAGGRWVFYTLGALNYLKQTGSIHERDITTLYGSSIGSVVCLLLALHKTVNEIMEIFDLIASDINLFKLINLKTFLISWGMIEIEALINIIQKYVNIPTFLTFADLSKDLNITGYAVQENATKYFNKVNSPDMPVLLAIKISCAIPIIFNCVRYDNDIYVDGGTVDYLPIVGDTKLLDQTIAINLTSPPTARVNNIFSFVLSLVEGIQKGRRTKQIVQQHYDLFDTQRGNLFQAVTPLYIQHAIQSGAEQCHIQRQLMLKNTLDRPK
jgi:predicted acylesterase/phospholipase RssA